MANAFPEPLLFREHQPHKADLIPIYEICAQAEVDYPLLTQWPVQVEILKPTTDKKLPQSWRNLPSRTYSTEIQDPKQILEMLAYTAFEWQAREIMLAHNNKARTPKEREIINALMASSQCQYQSHQLATNPKERTKN